MSKTPEEKTIEEKAMGLKRDYYKAYRAANKGRQRQYELNYWIKKVKALEVANDGSDTAKSR